MTIDSIVNGIVIDHIPVGRCMDIYRYLHLEDANCSVAILKNVTSGSFGRKDIIKLDERIDIDWDVLGYLAPDCTVNIIEDGKIVEKRSMHLPEKLVDVIRCKNPRCITTIEQELTHVFKLTDLTRKTYRCIYCEAAYGKQ